MEAAYNPAVFDVGTLDQAKRIILTPQAGLSTGQRWETETPYLLGLIDTVVDLDEDSVVLDYGCGVGRMSKALIEKHSCLVIGVDISPSMRALAAAYVSSPRFLACAPEALAQLGIKANLALAIWVLQHCNDVSIDIDRIRLALNRKGTLFLVNDKRRIVPTMSGWASDGESVPDLLSRNFKGGQPQDLDPAVLGQPVCDTSYWATYRPKG